MKHTINSASIFITANNHNPMIVSKDWINQKGIIEEECENFNHSPTISIFTSKTYELIVDQQKLELNLRIISETNLLKLPEMIKKYVEALPETPYTSLELSFTWNTVKDDEAYQILKDKYLNNDDVVKRCKGDHETLIGFNIFRSTKDYILRIIINPWGTSGNSVVDGFNINFYYILNVKNSEELLEKLNIVDGIVNESKEIVEKILSTEE